MNFWNFFIKYSSIPIFAAMYVVNVTSPAQLPLVSGCQNSGGTLEHFKEAREGSVEERTPKMDRETVTCWEKETQPTQLWYKNAATVIGCGVKKWISHLGIMKTKKMHI